MKYLVGFGALCLLASGAIARPESGIALAACHIANYSQEVLCGSHTVFEDRVSNTGRKIQINFAVIPAISEVSEPDPILILPGGPGQAAKDMGPVVKLAFREINQNRDVVLIDQRGMGSSHPLQCEVPDPVGAGIQIEFSDEEVRTYLIECLETLDADVTLYTQDLANQDIHEILIALGYQRINIYGGSWGTRAAQIYSQQFPEHVRSMILDGSAPFENKIPLFANDDAERALQMTFQDCIDDRDCNAAFPDLAGKLQAALERLGEKGIQVTMDDATTAETVTFTLTRDHFVNGLRAILYAPGFVRLLPIIIEQAARGEYKALSGVSSYFATQQQDTMALGASLSILCSEELSRITDQEIEQMSQNGFVGSAFIDVYKNACSVWPKAKIPAIYSDFKQLDIPVLILSGQLDPVTPPRWGEKMAENYPDSLHLIANNTGHNVAAVECADELMEKFVNAASVANLDGSCLLEIKRPSFFTSPSGPGRSKKDD
ncbi:MAG: alpha/beta fold hydrolase [Gammaproteobacteria bacterium]|nr:alpha/beta fold hydrolase [Gammaproteobacteria bacterium]